MHLSCLAHLRSLMHLRGLVHLRSLLHLRGLMHLRSLVHLRGLMHLRCHLRCRLRCQLLYRRKRMYRLLHLHLHRSHLRHLHRLKHWLRLHRRNSGHRLRRLHLHRLRHRHRHGGLRDRYLGLHTGCGDRADDGVDGNGRRCLVLYGRDTGNGRLFTRGLSGTDAEFRRDVELVADLT